jgi:hypothetical protein
MPRIHIDRVEIRIRGSGREAGRSLGEALGGALQEALATSRESLASGIRDGRIERISLPPIKSSANRPKAVAFAVRDGLARALRRRQP